MKIGYYEIGIREYDQKSAAGTRINTYPRYLVGRYYQLKIEFDN